MKSHFTKKATEEKNKRTTKQTENNEQLVTSPDPSIMILNVNILNLPNKKW